MTRHNNTSTRLFDCLQSILRPERILQSHQLKRLKLDFIQASQHHLSILQIQNSEPQDHLEQKYRASQQVVPAGILNLHEVHCAKAHVLFNTNMLRGGKSQHRSSKEESGSRSRRSRLTGHRRSLCPPGTRNVVCQGEVSHWSFRLGIPESWRITYESICQVFHIYLYYCNELLCIANTTWSPQVEQHLIPSPSIKDSPHRHWDPNTLLRQHLLHLKKFIVWS